MLGSGDPWADCAGGFPVTVVMDGMVVDQVGSIEWSDKQIDRDRSLANVI
jgi:hypothetical protein